MKLFISRFSVMCRLGMSEEEVIDAFRQERFPELEMTGGYLPGGVKVPLGRVNVPFTPSGSGPSRNDEMISQAVSQIADVISGRRSASPRSASGRSSAPQTSR